MMKQLKLQNQGIWYGLKLGAAVFSFYLIAALLLNWGVLLLGMAIFLGFIGSYLWGRARVRRMRPSLRSNLSWNNSWERGYNISISVGIALSYLGLVVVYTLAQVVI